MKRKKVKRPTIADIAEKAGLARGTVSMAINNDERIAPATREKVQRIIKELDYHPNEAARRLRAGKTGTIMYLCPRFTSAFMGKILAAAEEEAFEKKKYHRGILPFSTWNIEEERDKLLKEILYGRKADAVVMVTIRPGKELITAYAEAGIPLVVVEFDIEGVYSITVDNHKGAFNAGQYLIKKYGTDTAIVAGLTEIEAGKDIHPAAIDRMKGFKAALNDAGAILKPENTRFVRSYSYEEGREIMEEFIRRKKVPRSIFCAAGDITATGLIDAAKKAGVRVPQDVAVIGYDDLEIAGHMVPALTTVKQPLGEIGRLSFKVATEMIEGKTGKPGHIRVQPELIIRESA